MPSVCAASAVDCIYADATQHGLLANFNNVGYLPLIQGPASWTTAHVVSTNGTNGGKVADSGVVAANLVVASSPGVGLAHFAGSTQTATSSLVVAADVTSGIILTNIQNNTNSSLGTSTGSGEYIPGTSLTAGSIYYEASGGLTAAKADASSTVPAVCLAISTTQCMYSGVYRFSGSQSWTAGNLIYVSAASAGALVTTAPSSSGQYVQRVGVALANDTILLLPSLDVGAIQ